MLATDFGSLRVTKVLLILKAQSEHGEMLRLGTERLRETNDGGAVSVADEGPGIM